MQSENFSNDTYDASQRVTIAKEANTVLSGIDSVSKTPS